MCEKMEERVREEEKRRQKWGEIEQAYLRAKVWKNVALGLERGVDDQVSTNFLNVPIVLLAVLVSLRPSGVCTCTVRL